MYESRIPVGVAPNAAIAKHRRLFDACEAVFPVRFVTPDDSDPIPESVVIILPRQPSAGGLSDSFQQLYQRPRTLTIPDSLAGPPGNPHGHAHGDGQGDGSSHTLVRFANVDQVDRRLRGAALAEGRSLPPLSVSLPTVTSSTGSRIAGSSSTEDIVLATANGTPVWTTRLRGFESVDRSKDNRADFASMPLPELDPPRALKGELTKGRFFSLLPLVDFLRRASAKLGWQPPSLRACMLFDDPNLHWTSYGWIDFPELATLARRRGLHFSMATIPFDGWFVHPRAARLFREAGDHLSLIMHGNNHVREELGGRASGKDRLSMLAQALRRVRALEARSGVEVESVMAPPHAVCAEDSCRAMLQLGYDGVCTARPFPWLRGPPSDLPGAGWHPAQLTPGMVPIIPRMGFRTSRDELRLRAYLDQPLVLYGHHDDLRDGPDALLETAEFLDSLGHIEWVSIGKISRSNYHYRLSGATLELYLHTYRFDMTLPAEIRRIKISAPGKVLDETLELRLEPASTGLSAIPSVEVFGLSEADRSWMWSLGAVQPGRIRGRIDPLDRVDPVKVATASWRPWPVLRRFLTEARERARPPLHALRRH